MVGCLPSDRKVTANLFHQTNLLQIRDKDRNPAEGGHSSLGLTQNHPLAREQSSDFLRNQFVRGVCFHSPLSQAFKRQVQFSFGIQDKRCAGLRSPKCSRRTTWRVQTSVYPHAGVGKLKHAPPWRVNELQWWGML